MPETHSIIKSIRAAIDADYDNRLILAEANQWPADVRPYFGEGDECHMAFHFPLMPRIYMALRQEDRLPITDIMAQTPPIPDNCQWGLFLRNHDELTLEMVTDDERDYMYLAYSADPRMRVNVGIRRRLAPLVDNNRRRIELLNSLLLSFPGTPILYYGDEIGMGDNIYLGDRNGVRTPMQWNSDRNAGFSRCDPARLYFPVVMDPIYGYQVVNVEAQLSDQSSLLHWTRNMIALRKLFQVFGRGTLKFLNPANRKDPGLSARSGSRRRLARDRALRGQPQPLCPARIARSRRLRRHPSPSRCSAMFRSPPSPNAPYAITLAPYSFLWLELQPAGRAPCLGYDLLAEPAEIPAESPATAEALLDSGWASWLAGGGLALVESSLAEWLPRQRWFGAKARTIQGVRLQQWSEIVSDHSAAAGESPAADRHLRVPPVLLYAEVNYDEGPPDVYQIPIALSTDGPADEIAAAVPYAVLAQFDSQSKTAILHDATVREDTRQLLLSMIAHDAALPLHPAHASGAASQTHEDVSAPTSTVDGPLPGDDLASTASVAPVPITAQPGEAAAPPRSSVPAVSSSAQRMQPRESPTAGDGAFHAGRIEAQASAALTPALAAQATRRASARRSNQTPRSSLATSSSSSSSAACSPAKIPTSKSATFSPRRLNSAASRPSSARLR